MSFQCSGKLNATNTEDFIDKIKDTAVSAGWTLHDNLSSATPYGYVLTSTGEDSDQMPCYLYVYPSGSNTVIFLICVYWDNSTHTYPYHLGNPTYSRVAADDDGSFDCIISANKSCILASAYINNWNFECVGTLVPWTNDAEGTLDTAASAGSNVDLSLGAGEAAGFLEGYSYQIVDGNYRQWVEVNAVDLTTDTITITTLSYAFSSGAVIGNFPFRWFTINSTHTYCYVLMWDINGGGDMTTYSTTSRALISSGYGDPDERNGGSLYVIHPMLIYDDTNIAGITDEYFLYGFGDLNITTNEHPVSIGHYNNSEGSSTGSNTSTTLNDTSQSWTTDEWSGKCIIITGGTGGGQYRNISSNTSTELTITAAWTLTPDATSEYIICDEGWMYFTFNGSTSYCGAIRLC